MSKEETVRRYASELQRIFTDGTHGDYTALGFCVSFAEALANPGPDFTTHRGRVEWVRNDPACQVFRLESVPVKAVKRLREQWRDPETNDPISLVDARDAVYNAWNKREMGTIRNEWV